jgi:hypothetical protein
METVMKLTKRRWKEGRGRRERDVMEGELVQGMLSA